MYDANAQPDRWMYVHHNMQATVSAIPAGLYVLTYAVGSGWQKGNLMNSELPASLRDAARA